MIDISTETVVSLSEATRHLPRRRGKWPHVSCLYRWTQRGCKGIRLETIQIGGTRCTSVEALQRFFEALTAPTAPAAPTTTSRARQRSIAQAEADLADAGI